MGGWGREVSRLGDHVLRSPGPQSRTVISWLRHLRNEGCDFVPEPIEGGFAVDGREQLRYIPGDTMHGRQWSEEALWRIGAMLRQVHDASATFAPTEPPQWRESSLRSLRGGRPVIAHGDLGPWNILARDGEPVGFIDWDDVGPAGDVWELANVVWLNAQLHDDDVAELQGLAPLQDRAHQARLLLDGYELPAAERRGFISRIIEFAVRSAREEAIVYGVTRTTPSPAPNGFPTLWAITWRVRAAAWMYDNRSKLEKIIEA